MIRISLLSGKFVEFLSKGEGFEVEFELERTLDLVIFYNQLAILLKAH